MKDRRFNPPLRRSKKAVKTLAAEDTQRNVKWQQLDHPRELQPFEVATISKMLAGGPGGKLWRIAVGKYQLPDATIRAIRAGQVKGLMTELSEKRRKLIERLATERVLAGDSRSYSQWELLNEVWRFDPTGEEISEAAKMLAPAGSLLDPGPVYTGGIYYTAGDQKEMVSFLVGKMRLQLKFLLEVVPLPKTHPQVVELQKAIRLAEASR